MEESKINWTELLAKIIVYAITGSIVGFLIGAFIGFLIAPYVMVAILFFALLKGALGLAK